MSNRQKFMTGKAKSSIKSIDDLRDIHYFRVVPIRRGFSEIRPLQEMVKEHNSWICGGYARYCASPVTGTRKGDGNLSKAEDIDIYSYNEDAHIDLSNALTDRGYRQVYTSDYSVTFTIDHSYPYKDRYGPLTSDPVNIQLVKPSKERHSTGDVDEIIDYFDLTVCQAAIISPTEALVGWRFEEDEMNKRVRLSYQSRVAVDNIQTNKNPMITFHRCMKYASKGYKARPDIIYSIFGAWMALCKEGNLKVEEAKQVFEMKYLTGESAVTEATKLPQGVPIASGGYNGIEVVNIDNLDDLEVF